MRNWERGTSWLLSWQPYLFRFWKGEVFDPSILQNWLKGTKCQQSTYLTWKGDHNAICSVSYQWLAPAWHIFIVRYRQWQQGASLAMKPRQIFNLIAIICLSGAEREKGNGFQTSWQEHCIDETQGDTGESGRCTSVCACVHHLRYIQLCLAQWL